MPDVSAIFAYAAKFFLVFFVLFLAVPWLGAWFTQRAFERAKVVGTTPKQIMRAFLYSSSGTIVVCLAAVIGLRIAKSPAARS